MTGTKRKRKEEGPDEAFEKEHCGPSGTISYVLAVSSARSKVAYVCTPSGDKRCLTEFKTLELPQSIQEDADLAAAQLFTLFQEPYHIPRLPSGEDSGLSRDWTFAHSISGIILQVERLLQGGHRDGCAVFDGILVLPAYSNCARGFARYPLIESLGIQPTAVTVSRLEATAAHTLGHLGDAYPNVGRDLEVGDKFGLCHIGAKTFELALCEWTVDAKGADRVMVLNVVRDTSGQCAGGAVDKRFSELARRRVGLDKWDTWGREHPKSLRQFLDQFEKYVKPNFSLDPSGPYRFSCLGLADDPRARIADGVMELEGVDVKEVHLGACDGIITQIIDQLKRWETGGSPVNHLVLTGGFSRSKYLSMCVRLELEGFDVRVYNHKESTVAAAKGALSLLFREPVL